MRQVVPGRGRRGGSDWRASASCARNKTPLRSTSAWPARRAHAAPTEPVAGRRRRGYAPQGPKRWASAVRRTHDQQPAGATLASASCARNKTPLRSTAAWPARRARPAPREAPAERRWRREAPPAYSTDTWVTAGRATGLVDGRRRPSTALHAAETSPRAGAGCVATTESARHARARGARRVGGRRAAAAAPKNEVAAGIKRHLPCGEAITALERAAPHFTPSPSEPTRQLGARAVLARR